MGTGYSSCIMIMIHICSCHVRTADRKHIEKTAVTMMTTPDRARDKRHRQVYTTRPLYIYISYVRNGKESPLQETHRVVTGSPTITHSWWISGEVQDGWERLYTGISVGYTRLSLTRKLLVLACLACRMYKNMCRCVVYITPVCF